MIDNCVGEKVKRSRSIVIFLLVLISFTHQLKAQVPGYMGKRISAGYGFNCSPSFVGANPNNRFLNMIHELYLDWTISEKWTMGPSFRFYRTIYDNQEAVDTYLQRPETYYTIDGLTFALNFKYFKKNYLAPWGSYFMLSPVVNAVRTTYDPYMHIKGRTADHDTLYADFGEPQQQFYHFDIMIGWGRNRIIADRICIDYGFNMQLLSQIGLMGYYALGYTSPLTTENYIEQTHKQRVRGMNLINVFLKVGYLF